MPPLKILIVDDEVEFCELLSENLKLKIPGTKIFTATSGRKAFDLLANERPRVIVSDIRMPNGDGFELLERVRRIKFDCPPIVILTTGFADLEFDMMIDEGAEAVFTKPFELDELVRTLTTALIPLEKKWQMQRRSVEAKTGHHLEIGFIANARRGSENELLENNSLVKFGRGGCFLPLTGHFPLVDTKLSFCITLDAKANKKFSGVATVRWVRRQTIEQGGMKLMSGCGLEFNELNDDSRAHMIQFIQHVKPKSFIPRNTHGSHY